MTRLTLKLAAALAAVSLSAGTGRSQVVYNAFPVFSNGYVVNIPNSPAAPTTTYYPGGTGASVFPSPNATMSGNRFIDGGSNPFRTFQYPSSTPVSTPDPFALTGPQQSTFNPILNPNRNLFQDSPLGTFGSSIRGLSQPPSPLFVPPMRRN